MRLNGRKALVTGGARGIGRAIVLDLARAGASVVTCTRQGGEAAETLEKELRAIGGEHHVATADVTEQQDIDTLVGECERRWGRIDVVVNNAGAISHVPFAELDAAEWHRVVDTGLTATAMVIQRALPLMGQGGSIINIGSKVATVGIPLRAHYTAAKAGLIGLTRSLTKELGERGIRVNLVAPGPVETEAGVPDEVRERYRRLIALGRMGRPEEIATVVTFLAGDLSAFINGETINVDGGI
ncbi:SDR family NAD(P)-dependent oxidoreductase [Nonomuraea diastatica]|uniref:3-oxoacyl-ACP reductase FabG n=1 Tax=Nonomuraea diastatica TaxID=1848329 RepID=A0A4R4W902_9ACTN|nr:3-oxoacyl-ACP reductase family protein [Nonomuraea diastatica]TDD12623.1 3-oxoacyl-ACP reductase FabG [Nonomuraea diastatica]